MRNCPKRAIFLSAPKFLKKSTTTQSFPKQGLVFTCVQGTSFENTVGKGDIANTVRKGEIAQNEQFFLFTTVFSTHFENFCHFLQI